MRRRLLNLLKVLSLLLCVAVIVLVVRSYWVDDALRWARRQRGDGEIVDSHIEVRLAWGRLAVESRSFIARYRYVGHAAWIARLVSDSSDFSREARAAAPPAGRSRSFWERHGSSARRESGPLAADYSLLIGAIGIEPTTGTAGLTEFAAPVWPAALLATLPLGLGCARTWRGIKNRRMVHAGLCPSCGYDLRATPDKCPECGETRPPATSS